MNTTANAPVLQVALPVLTAADADIAVPAEAVVFAEEAQAEEVFILHQKNTKKRIQKVPRLKALQLPRKN